ncbi:MAG TPA: 4Fe-4S binding protein [Bacillota bacterium]|nr:4Fe-4S binding protein [Bacillota bacterium]
MFDMVGNIFKNLGNKPATRKYPFEKRTAFACSRGRVQGVDIDVCIFCGICARKCPADAIVVDRANKSWELDPFKCVICGACAEVCPKKCIAMGEQHGQVAAVKEKVKCVQQPQPKDNESQAG